VLCKTYPVNGLVLGRGDFRGRAAQVAGLELGLIGFVLAGPEGDYIAITPYGTGCYGRFGVRQIGFVCTNGANSSLVAGGS